ncbi:MAG: hypothetical protein ABEL76_05660, partial [Bradymonadaceae bacterium]
MPEQLRWDISLLGLAGLLALIVWIADLPWLIETDEPTIRGSRPPAARQGDVLLLLPDAPAGSADTFGELDCTFGWYNTLWQYFGAFATALERNLSPSLLEDRRLVVVPDRVADGMPENGVQALAEFAESGGQVLLVQPGDRWSEVAGVSPSSKTRPAESITSARGLGLSGRLRRALPEVPLAGQLTPVPATPPWPEGHSLLTVDKRPGLTVREVGAGAVYTAQFEIGCTVTALQQGRPDSGMSFGDQTDDRLLPTAERIAAPSMATARAPYADLLERAVLHRATELRPTPRIWSQPAHRAGSLLVVHPAPASPRAAFAFVDHARSHDSPTTVFAAADRWHERRGALADRAGTDVGLLWVRGSSRPKVTQRYRLGGLTLVEREQSLDRQLAQLADGAAAFDPRRVARVEGAEHHARWSRTVRQLGAAGVRVDVSYGPHGDEQFGYLFGTGYPFYPVDRRGLPVPVAELPYVLHGPSLSIERLETFLRQSRR